MNHVIHSVINLFSRCFKYCEPYLGNYLSIYFSLSKGSTGIILKYNIKIDMYLFLIYENKVIEPIYNLYKNNIEQFTMFHILKEVYIKFNYK